MANQTVYPYGQDGSMPSNIGIADNLTTSSAQQALSAKQGVVLKEMFDGLYKQVGRNYENGKLLDSTTGAFMYSSGKIVSEQIPAKKGDVVYWKYGTLDRTMYLVEYDESGNILNTWQANVATARTVTLTKDATAYIRVTINANYFDSAYVNVNDALAWKPTDGENGSIAELNAKMAVVFGGGRYLEHINEITWSNDGTYYDLSGEIGSATGYGRSSVLHLTKGQTICAEMYSGNYMNAISIVDKSGNFIGSAVVGRGENVMEYIYTAEDDCYIVLSAYSVSTHPYICLLYYLSSSGNSDSQDSQNKIIEDSIPGNGDTIVRYYFPAKPGDYIHISFPNGDWPTLSSRENYNKFWFGWRDNSDNLSTMGDFVREPWPIQSYGYDLYLSDNITDMKDAYLGFRAASGEVVPFVLTWLSKDEMKDYFSDEMADTVAKVRARQGNQSATIMVCTDIHYRDTYEQYRPFAPYAAHGMGLTMKEFARRVRIDNLVCMGDAIDGLWDAAQGKMDARDVARILSGPDVPILYAIGNHDDNRYYAKNSGDRAFTAKEIYAEFIQQVDERTSVGGAMQGCNYYRDIERLGLRLIVLMSINFNKQYYYTTDTQNFLTATLNSMPEGYKAVIFTHTPLLNSHTYSNAQTINGGSAVSSIIESNREKVIGLFYGHTHFDNQWMSPFVEINEGCSKVYNPESGTFPGTTAPEGAYFAERAAGDYREHLWDAVVIDKVNSLLSCIRFGAGVDRYVHISPVEVAAGGTTTLTPSVLTAASWETRTSEASSITIESGVVSVASGATSGARLTAICKDASGNMEFWVIKVA